MGGVRVRKFTDVVTLTQQQVDTLEKVVASFYGEADTYCDERQELCLSVSVSTTDLLAFVIELHKQDAELARFLAEWVCHSSWIGFHTDLYWPSIRVDGTSLYPSED